LDEGGTAIGDAIALAAARLQTTSVNPSPSPERAPPASEIAGRIMILLTDGGNNAGVRDPLESAQLAARWGIRIYTVGIGGRAAQPESRSGPLGRFFPAAPPVQEGVLQAIAETTGGQFRMAEDAEGLLAISQEIDRQERSEARVIRRWKHQELGRPFVLSAFLLLSVEVLSSCTVFRKFP
jgi:Ca-activated chloride channel family protein